jgi:general secretion pathway protein I
MKVNKKAFSLLEVLLALAICAGLLMSVVSVVNYHLKVVVSWKQRDQLYTVAGNVFELIKKKLAVYQGRLAEPFSDYSYQADISGSPYHGCELLTMKISGPKEEFVLSEYILSSVESDELNEKKL